MTRRDPLALFKESRESLSDEAIEVLSQSNEIQERSRRNVDLSHQAIARTERTIARAVEVSNMKNDSSQ